MPHSKLRGKRDFRRSLLRASRPPATRGAEAVEFVKTNTAVSERVKEAVSAGVEKSADKLSATREKLASTCAGLGKA